MPITRAKATVLLNQREMSLYDDSRANAIRGLDAKALSSRITRARDARSRARDLVQRQKLSSRDRTGNKRGTSGQANQRSKDKAELMADILRRFETQLANIDDKPTAKPAAGKTAKTAKKKSPAGKSAARRATRREGRKTATAAKKIAKKTASATPTKKAVKKAATKPAPTPATTGKPTKKKAAGRTAKAAKRTLTPRQALKKTRALLEAKQQRDREPKPWDTIGGAQPDAGQPGYQSSSAARRARELHAAESRIPAIQGSISTRDRINQGKRDHRGNGGTEN
ncbi:MAG: hypothetical protein NVV60_11535 [Luteimonas sp.]|nr:hypothetical protein [Luteimonas sp.]